MSIINKKAGTRTTWNAVTKIKLSDKLYNRNQAKKELHNATRNQLERDNGTDNR